MLNVSRLNKRFGDLAIFENFDLTLSQNGFTVLIGPSGCGKSTLFKVLTGAVDGDGGEIEWGGQRVSHLREISAYMQQKDMLLPWFSLMENAVLPARVAGADMAAADKKATILF
jgi:NitT/TauT family transport system ATP-binding protein